jgi:hypothetical protein
MELLKRRRRDHDRAMFRAPLVVGFGTDDNDVDVGEIIEVPLNKVGTAVTVGLHRDHQCQATELAAPWGSLHRETGELVRRRALACSIEGVKVKLAHSNSVMTSTLRPWPHQRHVTDSTLWAMTSGSSTLSSPPTL